MSSSRTDKPKERARKVECSKPTIQDDDQDRFEYEWQFEILNSLPRERALGLVAYLQRTEQERAKACSVANQLHLANCELQQQLQDIRHVRHTQDKFCCRRIRQCCRRGCAFAALLALVVAVAALASENVWSSIYENTGNVSEGLRLLPSHAGVNVQSLVCPQGPGLRQTTVKEMTIRETTTREYSKEEFENLVSEHEVLSEQFARLNSDISSAVHNGQDMVCWKV